MTDAFTRLDATDPSLTPALKHRPTSQIFRGQPGDLHSDIAKRHRDVIGHDWLLNDDIQPGFVNHKGHFLSRQRALAYAQEHDLLNERAKKYFSSPGANAGLGMGVTFLAKQDAALDRMDSALCRLEKRLK